MRTLIVLMSLFLSGSVATAGIYDSDYFEPGVIAIGAGAAGYFNAVKGQELTYGGIFAAAGFAVGMFINSHYKDKYTIQWQGERSNLQQTINEFKARDAQRAAQGDTSSQYSLHVYEYAKTQKDANGAIHVGGVIERCVPIGEGTRSGYLSQ